MRKIHLVATAACALLFTGLATSSAADEELRKRIAPVGQVYLDGEAPVRAAADTGPRSGEQVYQTACFACHGTGALDAPKPGDASAWQARIDQGFDVMLRHSIDGFGNMPAMGTCMNCSEDEIAEAIRFMIKDL